MITAGNISAVFDRDAHAEGCVFAGILMAMLVLSVTALFRIALSYAVKGEPFQNL